MCGLKKKRGKEDNAFTGSKLLSSVLPHLFRSEKDTDIKMTKKKNPKPRLSNLYICKCALKMEPDCHKGSVVLFT